MKAVYDITQRERDRETDRLNVRLNMSKIYSS
jgi:hypothetical protein